MNGELVFEYGISTESEVESNSVLKWCMIATQGVTAHMECFMFARFWNEDVSSLLCNIGKLLGSTEPLTTLAHLHRLHHCPCTCSAFPSFLMNFTVTLSVKISQIYPPISFLLLASTATGNLCISSRPSFYIMYIKHCPVFTLSCLYLRVWLTGFVNFLGWNFITGVTIYLFDFTFLWSPWMLLMWLVVIMFWLLWIRLGKIFAPLAW